MCTYHSWDMKYKIRDARFRSQTDIKHRITSNWPFASPLNFIIGSDRTGKFQAYKKFVSNTREKLIASYQMVFCIQHTYVCLLGLSGSSIRTYNSSSPGLKHYSLSWTCLSVVSTSQTSIKTFSAGQGRKQERQSEKDPSHLSPLSS